MRLAFAGVGHPHAPAWAAAARASAAVELAGAWDPEPGRLAAFCSRHDLEAWPAERLGEADGALVAARNPELLALAERARAAGLPVLVEKPGGMNAAELGALEALGGTVRIAYFLRHSDPVRELRGLLADGALGQVSLARLHVAMPAFAWTDDADWFRDPGNVRGMFLEDGSHALDVAHALFGSPRAVIARSLEGAFDGGLGEDALVAVLDHGTHLLAVDFTAWEHNPWVESWTVEVHGTAGTVRAGLLPSWRERFAGGAWERTGAPHGLPADALEARRAADHLTCFGRTLEAFAAAARGEDDPAARPADGRAVVRVAEAAYESAGTGRAVDLRSQTAA